MIESFHPTVQLETIDELRSRLLNTRWPSGVTDDGGVAAAEMRQVVSYWAEQFDWAVQERALNRLPHFVTTVAGLRLHYVHAKSPRPSGPPLLLLHGWPGSFVEMLPLVPLLDQSCDVVVPSLPGYGFSEAATAPGMSNARIADLMAELMSVLGYHRFVVQGGDWGAGIATWLALRFPSRVAGIHLNYIPGSYAPFVEGDTTRDEDDFLSAAAAWRDASYAYGHVQRTRPLTLSYALSDSPVGLAAWIIEKFREWADPRSAIPLDIMLTNVTIYWATNSIASSMRLYLESARTPLTLERGQRVSVPCGIAHFPYEAPFPPRSWIDRGYNVTQWSEMPRGGHFAAIESPIELAADVSRFVESLPISRREAGR